MTKFEGRQTVCSDLNKGLANELAINVGQGSPVDTIYDKTKTESGISIRRWSA